MKKKQKMADENKARNDAMQSRVFYLDKIKKFKNALANGFDELSASDLCEKAKRIQSLFDSFEAKCLALNCIDAESGTSAEDE